MAKVFSKKRKEIMWEDTDGFLCLLEETLWDIQDVLAAKKLDGHDEYDQWLIRVEHDMDHLLDTLTEKDYSVDDLLDREPLAEVE